MMDTSARRLGIGVLLILLLALGLRLAAIDRQDIWGDEAFSISLSQRPLPQVVAGGADTHPPLYPFLLYAWLRLAGSSPLAVRTLSAFVGTLIVAVVYVLGRHVFGRTTGVLAALLAAVSPVLVYYSQETRMYGLVALLSAVSVYWAFRAWRGERHATLPYVLASLGAAYTHYYAFFVIAAENLVIVPSMLRRRQWPALRRWLVAQAVVLLAYVPWIVVQRGFLSGKASARFGEWDLSTALGIADQTFQAFGAGLAVPADGARVVSALFLLALAAGLVALLIRRRAQPWLLVAWLFVPLVLAWGVNPIMPFFYPRYLLLIAPAFYLLVAGGLMAGPRIWRPWGAALALLLLAGSAYGLRGYYADDTYAKGRYGQMMAYIGSHARPGDGLLLANPLQRPLFEYYRPKGMDAYYFPRPEVALEDARSAGDLKAIAAQHPRLWLVRFGNPAEYDPTRFLDRWLASRGSKAYFGGWGDADLSLYVMTPAGTGQAPQHPLQVDLGDRVRLLGYALSADQVKIGDTLLLTLYWQGLAPMEERYTVFTHLLAADNTLDAQMDCEPQGGGLPTDRWTAGQVVQDNYALTVSESATVGPHLLEVGMYHLPSGQRLPASDASTGQLLGDRVVLGTVEVLQP